MAPFLLRRTIMSFREDFAWGVASSAYQIEGAAYEDGKGLSVWDMFCKKDGTIQGGATGDVACDHYHRYKEDIAIMKEMGQKAYRFSLCWSRIMPNGTGEINPKGLEFYDNLINELLANGIEPYITLFHWDTPYEIYRKGSWLNDDSPDWFAEYAKVVTEHFSDRVKYFITINEPQCFIGLSYVVGVHAPGLKLQPHDTVKMAHNVLLAHGKAVMAMRAAAKQPIKIGYAPSCSFYYPETDSDADVEAARAANFKMGDPNGHWSWNIPWWSDPVFLGKYPDEAEGVFAPYMPKIGANDFDIIGQELDFLGYNIYNGTMVRAGEDGGTEFISNYAGFPKTQAAWTVNPETLYYGPKFLYERYKKPIYITENGIACHDVVSLDGKVHDPNRIDFTARYLRELKRASADGIDVRGYFYWSNLDNFEWECGYERRFGMVYVDFRTQERIIKDSGYWYKEVIEQNGENL